MAVKRIESRKGVIETKVAERISTQFDQMHDIKDTFTLRLMNSMRGKSDDAVRSALMLALKRGNSKTANIKIRFTRSYAEEHLEELVELAKTIQLENEARIYELRDALSEEVKSQGKLIAKQNYALMIAKTLAPSTLKEEQISNALRNTGKWYIPETAVFHLELDFAGLTKEKSGLNLEKKIDVTDSNGHSEEAYRVITQVGGAKACPVNESNKDKMADMLYDILVLYDKCFKTVDGADMNMLLNATKEFVKEYRVHSNTSLIDTTLSTSEKDECQKWAQDAINWIENN